MPQILVVGDTHIGRLQSSFADKNWLDWSLAPLRQVEEYAINNGIPDIIQLGDIFDTANPSQRLLRALTAFLLQSKCNWYFNIGNHDVHSRGNHSCVLLRYLAGKKRLKNCHFFPKATAIEIAGVPTVFLPWPKRRSPLLNARPSLVIAHVERQGARYDNGRQVKGHKFDLGKHFWCIGHLHEWQTFDNLIFPGAVSQLRYGDGEAKWFLHLRIKPSKQKIAVKYKRIKFTPQFILRDLMVNQLSDLTVLRDLPENVFIRLIIQQDVAVPEKYFRHPQVIKHRFYGSKQDLRAIKQDNFNLQSAKSTMQSRIGALRTWLHHETRLPKSRRNYALRYAKKLEQSLLQAA